jgi:hypothetical protein
LSGPAGPRGIGAGAEQLHGLRLGRRREGDERDAGLAGPRGHLRRQDVFRADLAAVFQLRQLLGAEHGLELGAASPACELWASSAMTAKRLPWVAASLRTSSMAKGKVWMVQTTIFLSPDSASASLLLLLPSFLVIFATTPCGALEIEQRLLELRIDDVAVGHHQHGIEDLLVAWASCSSAKKWAVQAMELVLPEPAEC